MMGFWGLLEKTKKGVVKTSLPLKTEEGSFY
jgi:hypothetical protein